MKKLCYTAFFILLASCLFAQTFPPTIDAQRDPWYATLTDNTEGFLYFGPEAVFAGMEDFIDDEGDLSALCWIAWDETYLYAYLEVKDELVQVNNATYYENDAVEFKIDPDPTAEAAAGAGVAAMRLSALGADDAEVPAGVDNLITAGELGNPDGWEPLEGEDYDRAETNVGYNLEWRLPFSAMVAGERVVTVGIGEVMGLAINVMDNDDVGRQAVENWSAMHEDLVWNDPPKHGTIYFLADHKFKMENLNYYSGEAPVSDSMWYKAPAWYLSVDPILDNNLPLEFELAQNYPNPFNPTTTIPFTLNKAEEVSLAVYNVNGELIRTLVNNRTYAQGKFTETWDGTDNTGAQVASGVYLYQLKAGKQVESRKMLLVK
jgi:hypothetical protein